MSGDGAKAAPRPPWGGKGAEPERPAPSRPRPTLPSIFEPLIEGLDEADAFEVDERFRRALSMEQRLEARIGPLLTLAWKSWVHRALEYRTRDAYVRERLGMDPEAFRRGGGRPPRVCGERGNAPRSAPEEVCLARFIGLADIVQLFRAVLCTVRRRMERHEGRLPTEGEALGAMLDHVFFAWGLDQETDVRHKVFARGAAPGCTSMRNLHSHHIRFRSAEGSDAPENRITLCAFHHLRGVHAGRVRCTGRAPDGLKWEMGIRPGRSPLLSYRSGDVRVPARQ